MNMFTDQRLWHCHRSSFVSTKLNCGFMAQICFQDKRQRITLHVEVQPTNLFPVRYRAWTQYIFLAWDETPKDCTTCHHVGTPVCCVRRLYHAAGICCWNYIHSLQCKYLLVSIHGWKMILFLWWLHSQCRCERDLCPWPHVLLSTQSIRSRQLVLYKACISP